MPYNDHLFSTSSYIRTCKISKLKRKEKSIYSYRTKKFIKHKHLPLWYKELSQLQMVNANELLSNLRDDMQQGTTHRTKLNLQILGICPLPTRHEINLAMQFSEGNDLAFLWFLLELYYSNCINLMNPDNKIYDMNQQIIMSTIVHLDLCPTLRELDRLLPKPRTKLNLPRVGKLSIKRKKQYISHYLEPLPMPVSHKISSFKIVEYKPNFYPYNMYTDPNYVCPNELNRWYADPEQVRIVIEKCEKTFRSTNEQKISCAKDLSLFQGKSYTSKSDNYSMTESLDYDHHAKIKENKKYFTPPNSKFSYTFDYAHIFDHKIPELRKNLNKLECIKKTVEEPLKIKKYKDNEDEANLSFLIEAWNYNQKQNYNINRQNYKNNFKGVNRQINPNNTELMDSLLLTAVKEMKKNPNFVMVQLPQIQNLQILQLWIRVRFGYTITEKQKTTALKITKHIIDEMCQIGINIQFPKASSICHSRLFYFSHKKNIKSKADLLMHMYFNELKDRLLADTRIYWHCMHPTHCNADRLREIFYSYLPAKPQDIFPFRPWGSNEFTDKKSANQKRFLKNLKNN